MTQFPLNQPIDSTGFFDPTTRTAWLLGGSKAVVPQVPPMDLITATSQAADSAQAITTAAVLGSLYIRSGMTAGRIDTLPSAAALVAAIPNAIVGTAVYFNIINANGSAIAVTIAAGAGGTLNTPGTYSVNQSNAKPLLIVLTNVTPASEAYTVYSLGASSTA
jgi:hypothetical protein